MGNGKSRYKKMESIMTAVLIIDAVVFITYLIFAGIGMSGLKLLTAALCILISAAVLYFLYVTRELLRKRSIWMSLTAACIIVCILVSLLVRFPAPVFTLPQVS